jgi:hypothetical protein
MSKIFRSNFTVFFYLLFGFLILSFFLLSSPRVGIASREPTHKVIAPKNLISENGSDVTLWHDYGSFALYHVTHEAWLEIPVHIRSQVQLADDMNQLLIGENPIDAQQKALQQDDADEAYTGESLHLIQFAGPIKDEWLKAVEATGTELVHYIPNNGYLVWADASGRHKLNILAEQGTFLQLSIPYLSSFKLGPTLGIEQATAKTGDDSVIVTVQLYRHDRISASEAILNEALVDSVGSREIVLNFQNVTGTIRRNDIPVIAGLPDVVWIGEHLPRELNDEVQGQIMANNLGSGQNAPLGPGYLSWLINLGLSTDPNSYPIVDITDDGIGNGLIADTAGDVTLRELGKSINSSRLAYIANCTSAASGASPEGHGHINVSIAGGYDDRSGFPYQDANGYQRGLGINPFGRFAGTRVFDQEFNLSGCGGTDRSLIRETYNRGARIVSNSWGCSGCAGLYDTSSQAYDASVRDADSTTEGNQELFILFSAGNSGPVADTIGSPGNGKNMITIGASENVRPTWTDGCGIDANEANFVQDIAIFSSRGPAPGERTKPDVVAPGTHVQGTASTDPTYNGFGVCDRYHPGNQAIYTASSGTSHSTPAVAGMASLAYAFLQQQYDLIAPSPALLKAFIIAHTMYLNGSGSGGNLPNNDQGYGLPDMNAAFDDTPRVIVDQVGAPLFDESGETWSLTVSAADSSKPIRIVMAYTDQPGAVGRQPQVNDLNLSVQADGITYLGNRLIGPWSVPGGPADKVNNVEAVFLRSIDDSTLRINVTAFNIAGDGVPGIGDNTDQDFTIVCSNCAEQEDFTMSVQPASNSICRSGNVDYIFAFESVLGFSQPVALKAVDIPSGISSHFSRNPVTPPDTSLLTLTATETAAPGSYMFAVTGDSPERHHSALVKLDLYSVQPGAPELVAPPNGTSNLPIDLQLSWTSVVQAAAYDLQIALDSDFKQVIEEKIGLTETTYTPTSLQPGQVYYWRVRGVNSCAAGEYSLASIFSSKQLPGGCPIGVTPEILYSTDFEGSVSDWTHDGIMDTWQLSDVRSHSANTSFHAEGSSEVNDQKLISPNIDLPADHGFLTLQYWNHQALESNLDEDFSCFDGSILEISTNDGQSWQQIGGSSNDDATLITDPYHGIVDSMYGNPLSGQPAWCGDPQDWVNSVVRIDNYAGQTARFRFRLGSDASLGDEGWYIDDVRVQACLGVVKKAYLAIITQP